MQFFAFSQSSISSEWNFLSLPFPHIVVSSNIKAVVVMAQNRLFSRLQVK